MNSEEIKNVTLSEYRGSIIDNNGNCLKVVRKKPATTKRLNSIKIL